MLSSTCSLKAAIIIKALGVLWLIVDSFYIPTWLGMSFHLKIAPCISILIILKPNQTKPINKANTYNKHQHWKSTSINEFFVLGINSNLQHCHVFLEEESCFLATFLFNGNSTRMKCR